MNADELQNKAKALREDGQLEQAISVFKQAIELDESDPWNYLYVGNCHYADDDYNNALEYFKKAQSLMPENPSPYWCLANAYEKLGDIKTADMLYHKAVEADPSDGTAAKNLKRWMQKNK